MITKNLTRSKSSERRRARKQIQAKQQTGLEKILNQNPPELYLYKCFPFSHFLPALHHSIPTKPSNIKTERKPIPKSLI